MHAYVSTMARANPAGRPMSMTEARSPSPLGEALVGELKWVHNMIRRDHAMVSDLLDEVTAAARALNRQDDTPTRQRLAGALQRLAVDLLAHLQYEEEQISPTLRTWTRWPH